MCIWKGTIRMRQLLGMLLAMAVMAGMVSRAYAEDLASVPENEVIHPDEIQMLFDRYVAENALSPDLISVGYIYTATGETWYHNEDRWYYSASLYKVPLMMLYAEREAKGELTQDSEIFGMPLSYIEDEVLTYSNNEIAYSMMLNLAEPAICRDMFRAYTSLPDEYFTWEFRAYSCFSARFMTEVMQTLYTSPERFPGIAERLKNAQPGHYFRLKLDDCGIEIAQKYGNYHDEDGNDWNHTAGILYTPNPVILTVMTQYGGISELIISDLAKLFYDYTLAADETLLLLQQETDAVPDSDSKTSENEQWSTVSEEVSPIPDNNLNDQGNEKSPYLPSDQNDTADRWGTVCIIAAAIGILFLLCVIWLLVSHSSKHQKK